MLSMDMGELEDKVIYYIKCLPQKIDNEKLSEIVDDYSIGDILPLVLPPNVLIH